MDKQNNTNMQKGKLSGNLLLLITLIGFCILALIEILYGQAQIRLEKERLALEEENHRTVQELKSGWDNLQGGTNAGDGSAQGLRDGQRDAPESDGISADTGDGASGSISEQGTESEQQAGDDQEYTMQIVVLGDSIMANERENNGDVATLIGEATNAKVYNLAIGGTSAALMPREQHNYADWSSLGLLGVVNAMVGNINSDVFEGYETERLLRECDFSETDYFVVEYGLNDFLCRQIPQSIYLEGGETLNIDRSHTYAGALDSGVGALVHHFPNAKVLLVSPHYCEFFEDGIYLGNAHSLNYGYGTLADFGRITSYVASQLKADNVLFFNAMENSGIDAYSSDKFLEDGVHLSNEGRRMYADKIAEVINADFYRPE